MALPNTHFGPFGIETILRNKHNLFFAGIGGVSMNSLAILAQKRGFSVSGYDRAPSAITARLESCGIPVYYEADAAHVKDADALVYTVAMPETNPEYAWARERGIPLISRADFLGWLMTGYKRRIGVSGTHGKSTTTGMLSKILTCAGVDPTVLNGAPLRETGTVDRIGAHDFFAFEACEYMDSFLDFQPTLAVILNIELDHVDYFPSIEAIRASFLKFAGLTGPDGIAVLNLDDENCRLIQRDLPCRAVTFSRLDPGADYSSANEDLSTGYPAFDIRRNGETIARAQLRIPGEHNISNALAAFAASVEYGIDPDAAAEGLSAYEGIARRMEKLCVTKRGAEVYSDYAHHPTEIAATLKGARAVCRGKLRVVFQPHTYSRTAELFDGFVSAFAESGADEVLFCDIYAARETNTYGVSSAQLADAVTERGKPASFAPSFEEAARIADEASREGDMILVMGAGDVEKVGVLLKEHCAR
ncbi:MAG: UDP-N-acetylmuramate--L-alanine ligase [Ruminococcaceae bacterium]|jgi:UDP-N-acetylmuramate--alanine ligase|nr:UDP-N-acetylmuramate--L-alanine ligase [Oscillospiraceae bacterium]